MAILWDAEKFYDSLDLRLIVKEGQLASMDILVLTVCLEAYLCPRTLTVDGACSLPVDIANSILQGCRFANRMCRFAMYKTLDELHRKWMPREPSFSIDEYVDDLAQRGAGGEGLLENMAGIAVDLISWLSADRVTLGCKSTIVCSKPSQARALQSIIARKTGVQLRVARSARDLGIGYSAGTTRASAYWRARVALNKGRLERIRRLNRAKPAGWVNVTAKTKPKTGAKFNRICTVSAKKLFTTGAWPAISWGHQATGMTPADLDDMTILAAKASGHFRVGASPDVVCMLAYGGAACPRVKQVVEQLKEWIHLWGSLSEPERREARSAWIRVLERTRGEQRWRAAKGVMAATQATLFEIGWTPSLPFQWKDHEGDYWVQGGVETKPFIAHLKAHLEQRIWQKVAGGSKFKGLAEGGDLHGVRKHLRHLQIKSEAGAYGMLMTIVSGGVTTNADVAARDERHSPLCDRCGAAADTEVHRAWQCTANTGSDIEAISSTQDLVGPALREVDSCPAFWLRGIIPQSWIKVEPPAEDPPVLRWGSLEDIGDVHYRWYTDGTGGQFTKDPRTRRCAWAAVAVSWSGGLLRCHLAMGGALPGRVQTVPRAEAWAVRQVVQEDGRRNISLVTDCLGLDRHLKAGPGAGLNSELADIWSSIWDGLKRKGSAIDCKWVPSHTHEQHVEEGTITEEDHEGNSVADALVGYIAGGCQLPEAQVKAIQTIEGLAWRVRRRLIAVNIECRRRATKPPVPQKAERRAKPSLQDLIQRSGHKGVQRTKIWQCERCMQGVGAGQLYRWLAKGQRCPAAVPAETAGSDAGNHVESAVHEDQQERQEGLSQTSVEEDPFGHNRLGLSEDDDAEEPAASAEVRRKRILSGGPTEGPTAADVVKQTAKRGRNLAEAETGWEGPALGPEAPPGREASADAEAEPTSTQGPTTVSLPATSSQGLSDWSLQVTSTQGPTAVSLPASSSQAPTAWSLQATSSQGPSTVSLPATSSQGPFAWSLQATSTLGSSDFSLPATSSQCPSALSLPASSTGYKRARSPSCRERRTIINHHHGDDLNRGRSSNSPTGGPRCVRARVGSPSCGRVGVGALLPASTGQPAASLVGSGPPVQHWVRSAVEPTVFQLGHCRSGQILIVKRVIHESHSLAFTRGVVFCWSCAAYGVSEPRGLSRICREGLNSHGRGVLQRIRSGRPPKDGMVWPAGPEAQPPALRSG